MQITSTSPIGEASGIHGAGPAGSHQSRAWPLLFHAARLRFIAFAFGQQFGYLRKDRYAGAPTPGRIEYDVVKLEANL